MDLEELERLLFRDCQLGTREDFERAYGTDRPLGQFIRSIVGLDRKAVREAFSHFISNPGFSADQITFINRILEYFSRNGYMEKGALLEQPFTDIHFQGPYGIFTGDQVIDIISIIDTINNNAVGL